MGSIEIDTTTFEHSLRNLTKREILLILQQYEWTVDEKQSKKDLIKTLMDKIQKDSLTEDMYYTFREKAFSINKNFYDGFFYKIDSRYIDFDINNFNTIIKKKAESYTGDINVIVNCLNVSEELLVVNYERSKKDWAYDFSERRSRAYRQLIKADIEIYINKGLIYIHSKNLTDGKIIKNFLDKCFKEINKEDKKSKKALSEPKFDDETAKRWFEENKDEIEFKINGISLHMLDLFYQFESDESKFSNVCMKRIYFKENTIYTGNDEASITDSQYGGVNLQQHAQIVEEIKAGKRILGFSIDAEHYYEDEETGEEIATILPITVLYEDKNYLRLSISSESLVNNVNEMVFKQAYDDIKELYMDKYLKNCIFNTDKLKEYLVDDKDTVVNINSVSENNKERGNKWSL